MEYDRGKGIAGGNASAGLPSPNSWVLLAKALQSIKFFTWLQVLQRGSWATKEQPRRASHGYSIPMKIWTVIEGSLEVKVTTYG